MGMGTPAHKKIDRRTLEARRLKALELAITDDDMQAAILKKNAASLALAQELITARQARGEDVDPDLIVRVSNALQRAVIELNEGTRKKEYWVSQQELAERAEQDAWLATLTHDELIQLRRQVAGEPLPAPAPAPVPVVPALTDEEVAARARILDERARMQREGASMCIGSLRDDAADQGQGEGTPFDPVQILIEVLR